LVPLLTLLLLHGAQAVLAADLVTLIRGTNYQLLEDSDSPSVRIPLILRSDLKAADLRVEVVDVAFGQLEQPSLAAAVTPSLVDQVGTLDPALLLTFTAMHGLRAGTYDIGVRIHTLATPAEEQVINLHIDHPPAQLAPVPTISVVQTIGLPWTQPTIEPTSIQLRETSGLSRLSQVAITQDNPATADSESVGGRLRFDIPQVVPPRGQSKQSFTLENDFPVGTSTGSLVVDGPQLQAPVTLAFEVRTKLVSGWLIVVAALGLLLGLVARVWLKDRIALQDAKVQAGELLQTIDSELARRPDLKFQTDVKAIRGTLYQAAQGSNPKTISDATKVASDGLQAAIAALAGRRNEAQATLDALTKELGVPWRLPRTMRTLVAAAQKNVGIAVDRLASDDVSGALDEASAASKTLVEGLRNEAQSLQPSLKDLFDFLSRTDSQLDNSIAKDAVSLVGQIEGALASLAAGKPDAPLHDVLDAADTAFATYAYLLATVLPQLATMADDVEAILGQGRPDDLGAIAALSTAADALRSELTTAVQTADPSVAPRIRIAIQSLLGAARAAILAQRKAAPQGDRDKVETLIGTGAYSDAARAIIALAGERLYGEAAAAIQVVAPSASRGATSGVPSLPQQTGSGFTLLTTEGAPLPFAIRLKSARRSLFVAQAVQTIILGVVLMVIAYALYAPHFVGTPTELATIFLWAFAADVTVDAVLSARSSIPAPAAN
jgi:hypothetical protein